MNIYIAVYILLILIDAYIKSIKIVSIFLTVNLFNRIKLMSKQISMQTLLILIVSEAPPRAYVDKLRAAPHLF